MLETEDYAVCITRCETASALFGWEILRVAYAHVLARSSAAFSTRFEALADSARAAASLGQPQGRKTSLAQAAVAAE